MILKSFIKGSYLVSLSQILLTPYGIQTVGLSDWSLDPVFGILVKWCIRLTVTQQSASSILAYPVTSKVKTFENIS